MDRALPSGGPTDASALVACLDDPDWSAGAWESSCKTRLIRQRQRHDCGLACLAMAAGVSYEAAHQVFLSMGLDRGRLPLSSNLSQLERALRALGATAKRGRWISWSELQGLSILKIPRDRRGWHWVVAEPHVEFGIVLRDPGSPLVALAKPPLNVYHQALESFKPGGSLIKVDRHLARRGSN